MEGNDQAVAANEAAPVLGFWGKLGNIFGSPQKTFEALSAKPTWIGPLLIFLAIAILLTQLSLPVIMEAQKEKILSNPDISEEQREAMEPYFVVNTSARLRTLGGQVVITPIIFLVLAGIFYLVGSIFLGGDTTYKKVLAVVSWSWLIFTLATIVTMTLTMIKGDMNISLSLALLLSADAMGTKLHTFLSKFDFFTIWFLAVFATGFGVIYRFTTAKAYTAVGILWAIWIALSVALSGVFKQFGM
jgi:ABC-type multidrug transport system permease subunit